jgi:rhamnogalacturonan acetylesterase
MKRSKILSWSGGVVMALLVLSSFIQQNKPTFYLIGDSTVKNGQDDGQRKGSQGQWGWGHYIAGYFDTTRINVENDALGGTSSRTFRNRKDLWTKVLNKIKPGDYLIMQFGTNDDGPINDTIRARGTFKSNGDESQAITNLITKQDEVVHSYGWYIRQFVTEAKAKGATVIVCPPVPKNNWTNGKIRRNTDTYGKWASEAATQSGAFYIDLNKLVCDDYETEGEAKVRATYYLADATHTIEAGAQLSAKCVIDGIKSLPNLTLNKYLK